MTAIREFVKITNHEIHVKLPKDFNYDEVEVIIMPKPENGYALWSEEELKNIGNIGLESSMFEDDDEAECLVKKTY